MDIVKQALAIFALLTLITGVIYPLAITLVAQVAFPYQANGSLIVDKQTKQVRGSELLGQTFKSDRYFWSRPSATSPSPYNAGASSGSNIGPTNKSLVEAVKPRVQALRSSSNDSARPIPIDLVTSSASGLDPHISPAGAEYQAERVAKARGLRAAQIREMIKSCTSGRQLGFFGEETVNVVKLNLLLDEQSK